MVRDQGMFGNPDAVIEAGNGDPDAEGYTTVSHQDGFPSEHFVHFTDEEKRIRRINWEKQREANQLKEQAAQDKLDRKAWLKDNPPEAILKRSAETKTTLEAEVTNQSTIINKLKESIQEATETLKTLEDYRESLSKRQEEYSLFDKIIGTPMRNIDKRIKTNKQIDSLELKLRVDSDSLEHEESYLAELLEKLNENAQDQEDAIRRMPREY